MTNEKTVTLNGLPVHYWEAGAENGRPLLLIHSGLGDADLHWRDVIPQFAETYHVLAPDLPGYGGSALLPDMSAGALVRWLHDFLEAVGIEQAVVIGSSLGALYARLFAAAYPKVTPAVVLVNGGAIPGLPRFGQLLIRLPGLGGLLFQMMGRSATSASSVQSMVVTKDTLADDFARRVQSHAPNFARLMQGLFYHPIPAERTPLVPTLLLWGADDPMAPISDAEALKREIPGAKLSPIAECGHLPQLEVPDVFVYQVNYFLGRISRPPKADLPGVSMLSPK